MLFSFLFMMLGVAWRIWDGTGKGRKPIHPNMAGVLLCGIIYAWLVQGTDPFVKQMLILLPCIFAIPSLQRSYGGWDQWKNVYHFWPMMVASTPLVYLGYLNWWGYYVVALAFAGAFRPAMSKWFSSLPNWTRWAEGIEGAAVIGGLAFLKIFI